VSDCFSAISWKRTDILGEMMMVSVLYWTNTYLDIYSASSLKQQYTGRHVVSLGHIILIQSQIIFVLFLLAIVLSVLL
jgi:hypothetical protein